LSTVFESGGPWEETGVDPVKLALPSAVVGYTLRAYRPASQVSPTEVAAPDDDEDGDDDLFAARERARAAVDLGAVGDTMVDQHDTAELDHDEPDPSEFEADEADEADAAVDEEVPLFLSHRGRLLLFGSAESLVAFIRSDAPHDMQQLEDWSSLRERVQPSQVVPSDDDTYELDLVVENLRGGHDAWDLPLLISAGEIARDLGFALRLRPVVAAMSAGSPLDALDDALRATAAGGVGSLFARRRLRRIGAQQASLGWRTVIGKISHAIDWRE
jgi:hypothetical protein